MGLRATGGPLLPRVTGLSDHKELLLAQDSKGLEHLIGQLLLQATDMDTVDSTDSNTPNTAVDHTDPKVQLHKAVHSIMQRRSDLATVDLSPSSDLRASLRLI